MLRQLLLKLQQTMGTYLKFYLTFNSITAVGHLLWNLRQQRHMQGTVLRDMYEGHIYVCMCVPNMKFVCLTLWLGEVCTNDTNADAATNDNDARRTIHDCKAL